MDPISILHFFSPIASALIIWFIQQSYIRREKERDAERLAELKHRDEFDRQRDRETKERGEARKQETLLTMRMIKAIGKLSYANSVAIREGKVNGVLEEAMMYYKDASDEMSNFLREQAIERTSR